MSHQEIIFHPDHQHCMRMSRLSSWYLIIRAVWSFLLPRLRSSDWDVPPTEKLHSEPWGRLLLRLCGCSWNRPCVRNGAWRPGESLRWWDQYGQHHGTPCPSSFPSLSLVTLQQAGAQSIYPLIWLPVGWSLWTQVAQTSRATWNKLFHGRAVPLWFWCWL